MDKDFRQTVMAYLAGKLSCRQVAEAITDYLDGSLSFWQRVRFELHLGMCLGCRNYLRQMKKTIQLLGTLPPDPIPDHIRDELLQRFRTWSHHQRQTTERSEQ